MKLTEKQLAVLTAVQNAQSGDFIVLRGFAGTGKSVTASEIMKDLDCKTLVITPTAAALAVLKRKIDSQDIKNVTFRTIASLMSRHQLVIKFTNYKEFSPVIGTRELVNAMKQFSDRNLQTVFEVQEEIADLHPALTIEEVAKAVQLKYVTREKEIIFKSDEEFENFLFVNDIDLKYAIDNFIIMVDTEMLSDLMIGKFKINPFDPIVEESQFDFRVAAEIADDISKYALVVIDEMSMMSDIQAKLYKQAVELCEDAPVTLVSGDPGQLKPVEGEFNEWCNAKDNGRDVFELTDVLRSTDSIATFGQMIRMNVPLKTIAPTDSRIVEFERNTSLNEIYKLHEEDFKQSDMVLAFTNKDVNELNEKIRYSKGLIGHVQIGDKIVVNRNVGRDRSNGILHANGQIYRVVEDLSKEFLEQLSDLQSSKNLGLDFLRNALERQIIKLIKTVDDEGIEKYLFVSSNCYSLSSRELKELEVAVNKSIRNNLNFAEKSQLQQIFYNLGMMSLTDKFDFPNLVDVRFAHAMTVHKSQGSQFKNVIYVVSSRDLWIQSQDLKDSRFKQAPVYVAVTRAIEDIKVLYIK